MSRESAGRLCWPCLYVLVVESPVVEKRVVVASMYCGSLAHATLMDMQSPLSLALKGAWRSGIKFRRILMGSSYFSIRFSFETGSPPPHPAAARSSRTPVGAPVRELRIKKYSE